jgi:hypothetical protein
VTAVRAALEKMPRYNSQPGVPVLYPDIENITAESLLIKKWEVCGGGNPWRWPLHREGVEGGGGANGLL